VSLFTSRRKRGGVFDIVCSLGSRGVLLKDPCGVFVVSPTVQLIFIIVRGSYMVGIKGHAGVSCVVAEQKMRNLTTLGCA
jgi:hypothetical protein